MRVLLDNHIDQRFSRIRVCDLVFPLVYLDAKLCGRRSATSRHSRIRGLILANGREGTQQSSQQPERLAHGLLSFCLYRGYFPDDETQNRGIAFTRLLGLCLFPASSRSPSPRVLVVRRYVRTPGTSDSPF